MTSRPEIGGYERENAATFGVGTLDAPAPDISKLSWRQIALLRAIDAFWEANDYAPTIRELQELTGMSSTSVVDYHLAILETKGLINRAHGSRPRTVRLARRTA